MISLLTLASGNITSQDPSPAAPAASARELAGLWEAKRRFGPEIRGPLLITRESGDWRAQIAAKSVAAKLAGDSIVFELPDRKSKFQGKLDARRGTISGHWTQPTNLASPVRLTKYGCDAWRGTVSPDDDTFTLYLMVKAGEDGSINAFLQNPERNAGVTQYPISRLERDCESVTLAAAGKGAENGRLLAAGRYDAGR